MSRALNNVRDGAMLKPPCARMGWIMEAAATTATEVAVNETIFTDWECLKDIKMIFIEVVLRCCDEDDWNAGSVDDVDAV
jgi:hypothetical protein